MQYSVVLLWFVIPSILSRDVVPTSVRHSLVKRYSYSYSYGYIYCNPGTFRTFYACPCNSVSTVICCCPYEPSLPPQPYVPSPPVPPPPITAHPIPLNGTIRDVISPIIAFLVILHTMLL